MCIFLLIDKVDKKLYSIVTTENFLGVAVLSLYQLFSIWIHVQALSCDFCILKIYFSYFEIIVKLPLPEKVLSLHFAKLSITNLSPFIGFVNSTLLTLVLKIYMYHWLEGILTLSESINM